MSTGIITGGMSKEFAVSHRLACFVSSVVSVVLVGLLSGSHPAPAASAAEPASAPLAQYAIEGRFGVSHADQLLFLRLPRQVKQGEVTLLDEAGKPVQSQVLSNGTLAVRTDLPAGEKRAWTLQAGEPAALPSEVTVTARDKYYEITNALVGIRLPTVPADLAKTPAPSRACATRMAPGPLARTICPARRSRWPSPSWSRALPSTAVTQGGAEWTVNYNEEKPISMKTVRE
jgi:hypothetical protein